ncbi:MAG: hypothetical protein QMC83_10165, partial [Thermodesulfovibrionales bacterium]|nr:hypothetical protein [Thermodesulfovibrionales bacterium]
MTPEERRKRKLALASEPDSIFFLVTYGGKSSSFMVRHLMDADRIIHLLRGRLGFSLTIEQVNEAVARYEKLLEAAWDYVYKFIPRLALVKPSSWRQLNDTPSEKAVLAGRFGSVAFLPRSEESGQLAMAVKLLNV